MTPVLGINTASDGRELLLILEHFSEKLLSPNLLKVS